MKRLSTTIAAALLVLRRFGTTRAVVLGLLALGGCAATGGAGEAPTAQLPTIVARTSATLAGGRCQDGHCACRPRASAPPENPPPAANQKRLEIRLSALGGTIALDVPTIGHFEAGNQEACFYVDVPAGSAHQVTLLAKEARADWGVGPSFDLTEYGPKGPYWYDVVNVRCDGPGGKCTRDAADGWVGTLRSRQRGRIDPCGSTVVSGLKWTTSGGAADRDGGLFRDFIVTFAMEVKKFATQFAPGSTECVPK